MSVSGKNGNALSPANEPLPFASELDQPRWSVVGFSDCLASGLSYDEAARLIEQMKREMPGLCIVTDEAARKMHGEEKVKRAVKPNEPTEDLSQQVFQETL